MGWISLFISVALFIFAITMMVYINGYKIVKRARIHNNFERDEEVDDTLFPNLLARNMLQTHLIFWVRRLLLAIVLIFAPYASDFIGMCFFYTIQMLVSHITCLVLQSSRLLETCQRHHLLQCNGHM